MLIFFIGAAFACEPDTLVQELWPSWGPVNAQGIIRVSTGGDNATLQIIDGSGGAWPVSGGPAIEAAPGDWFSFVWPEAVPDGTATLIAEPGTVQVEVEVDGNLADLPPDGKPALGAVEFEIGSWILEVCDTDGPTMVIATVEVVLPGASTGGFVAEVQDGSEVLAWFELAEERGPVTVEVAWEVAAREEICLSVNVFDPSHFALSQHVLDCEPVPEEFLAPQNVDDNCGCASTSPAAGAIGLLALLSLALRRR